MIRTTLLPRLLLLAALGTPSTRAQDATAGTGADPRATPVAERIADALETIGLRFESQEIEQMVRTLDRQRAQLRTLREQSTPNALAPATGFRALPVGAKARVRELPPREDTVRAPPRPSDLEAIAFADLATLSAWIRERVLSCEEVTRFYLARLERLDPQLHCVVHLCTERALAQARERDAELAIGRWRGPLHGIPWGAKDLFSASGLPTTWGAEPYREQRIEEDATVVRRLDDAGAILVAKLSLGSLAMGDVWFGGTTRNPWNPEQGSSGSSAGSASAVTAGAVPFALGTETLGSIVSPSVRCGATSLRPTFGRVSRHGAMALSWTMDKVGPICRSFEDCALVLAAIDGPDDRDGDCVGTWPFRAPARVEVRGWRIGYPRGTWEGDDREGSVLSELAALGVELVPVELPAAPDDALRLVLMAEAAAAFDELTRSGRDDLLVRQSPDAWPNLFRAARLIPAVEYVNAQRLRARMQVELHAALDGLDAIVHPPFWNLVRFNLSGHPTAVAPRGTTRSGAPGAVAFTGQLFDEARLLALARAWQESTEHHHRHPELR